MQILATFASLLIAQPAAPTPPKPPRPPPAPPAVVRLPADSKHSRLGSLSFSGDGKLLAFSRFAPETTNPLQRGGTIFLLDLEHPGKPRVISALGATDGNRYRVMLAPDASRLVYLADGELYVRALDSDDEAVRLYPPKEGDAPLGPGLTHAAWSPDSIWLLVQSPKGWARIKPTTGEIAPLALPPVDLTGGSLALSPDGEHAAFVRPKAGAGWQNGAKIVAVNIATGQAQVMDFNNLYIETFFLQDGSPIGVDSGGALWQLHGKERKLYFKPPPAPKDTALGHATVNYDATRVAYVATPEGPGGVAQLFVGGAPPIPPQEKMKMPEFKSTAIPPPPHGAQ
jgi:hypothetical protein